MKKLYFLALAAFLFAACNNQPDPEPQPPTFEEQFCKKWECWKLMFGEIEREMEEDEICF